MSSLEFLTERLFASIGRIAVAFAELEHNTELCVSFFAKKLPTKPDLQRIAKHNGFKTKVDVLKKHAAALQTVVSNEISLSSDWADKLCSHLDYCLTLAEQRNRYVHALVRTFDPDTFRLGTAPQSPTIAFLNRRAEFMDSAAGQDVTMKEIKAMTEFADTVGDAASDLYVWHYMGALTADVYADAALEYIPIVRGGQDE